MRWRVMMVSVLLACSAAVHAEPGESPRVFGHRDANGRMVFSDQEQGGAQQVKISKPSVVTDSKLGVKAYSRQTPRSHEKNLTDETRANLRRDMQRADAQADEEDARRRCEGLREIISHSQYGSKTYRQRKQNQYDRECIANGY